MLVGLDVGTTGVKAIAIDDGRRGRRASRGVVSAVDAAARLGGAGSGRLGARVRDGARRARRRRAGGRAVGPDARARLARRGRRAAAAGDPLERPAHRSGVRGDRAPHRPRPADRADGQPGAHGLHRAEAALAAHARARRLRAHPLDPAAEGLRAPQALRPAGDRRRGRLRDVALRRRRSARGATR